MKSIFRKTLGLTAAMAMLAGPAMADQYQDHNHGGPQGQYDPHPPGPSQHSKSWHGEPPHQTYAPPPHGWHEGDHYNGHRESVDWHHHHDLRQPPSGYEWVQSGNQFVMIAVTTGIIASIIASSAAH